MSKKKKNQTKAKRGREKTCDRKLKKSNTLPNRINPKQYYIQKYNDSSKKNKQYIYIYIERERERERVKSPISREKYKIK